jgi:cytochrome c-type biogenesis protein CcmH
MIKISQQRFINARVRYSKICWFIVLVSFATSSRGLIEVDQLSSVELSNRYRNLVAVYRCPKCQNQNLAESDSPISMDLRREIRRLLEQGQSDEAISQYLIERYGDFILYRPRFQPATYLLWLAPALLLCVGMLSAGLIIVRQRSAKLASDVLDVSEQEKIDALISQYGSNTEVSKNESQL